MNARRTEYRDIPREIAQALQMNFVFGCEFEELAEGRPSYPACHGQATLSRLPVLSSRILRFDNQSHFWYPRWFIPQSRVFQRRLGGRMALITHVAFSTGELVLYNVHLESRGIDRLRCSQLSEICNDLSRYKAEVPVVLAGDFNFNLCHEPVATLLTANQLENPFACDRLTAVPSHHGSPGIDWILTRGPVEPSEPILHDLVRGSDHQPLSLTLSRIQP